MAVAPASAGKGFGSRVLVALEAEAERLGASAVVLNAREGARAFYQRHNYSVVDEADTLFGSIRHFRMIKRLPPR
jgi:ribosomal protein S18 acetylase RimI-like enzyme